MLAIGMRDFVRDVLIKATLWTLGTLFSIYIITVMFLYGIQFLTSPFMTSLFNISPDSIAKMERIEENITNLTKFPITEEGDD